MLCEKCDTLEIPKNWADQIIVFPITYHHLPLFGFLIISHIFNDYVYSSYVVCIIMVLV